MTPKELMILSIISDKAQQIENESDDSNYVENCAADIMWLTKKVIDREAEVIGDFKDENERDKCWDDWTQC